MTFEKAFCCFLYRLVVAFTTWMIVDMYGAESHMFAYIAKLLSDQDAGVTPSQV